MDINANRDDLKNFNDSIEGKNTSSGIFKGLFRANSATNWDSLFSLFSLTISWGEIIPHDIRQFICDYIEQKMEFSQYEERDSDIDKYIRNMKKDKAWMKIHK